MPFENFYEESDKFTRRWWKFIGLGFLIFIGYWVAGLSLMSETDRHGVHPSKPSGSELLRRVDALCTELPKPEKFYFARREGPFFQTDGTAVIYYYKSDRELDEIMPVFTMWFAENGWKLADENYITYKKERQTVSLTQSSDFFDGNIQIYCEERKSGLRFSH